MNNIRGHYIFACALSYPCQALQCWNAAWGLVGIANQLQAPQPSAPAILITLILIAFTAFAFVWLGAYRARWRALYLHHRANPFGGSNDGRNRPPH